MKTICFLLLVLISISSQVSCAAPNLAILHADYVNYAQDVQLKLAPFYTNITLISVQNSNPTAAQLGVYDAVLVFSDFAFFDYTQLGNLLADYIDAGKGVIVSLFGLCTYFSNGYVGGRFAGTNFNQSYYLIAPGARLYNPELQLSAVDTSSPLLTGVRTFDGGSYSFRAQTYFTPLAHPVAVWSDSIKTPLIATGTAGRVSARRVDLNFFPPSSTVSDGYWLATTDGARILANAFAYVLGGGGNCTSKTDCASCANSSCQWCLDTGVCSTANLTCPNRVVDPLNCPAPLCSTLSTCSGCVSDATVKTCSWCLDNSTCVIKNTPCKGEINDKRFCASVLDDHTPIPSEHVINKKEEAKVPAGKPE